MKKVIDIYLGDLAVQGMLNESSTATLIWEALPLEGGVSLWGEEIYFNTPVESKLDDTAKNVVEIGDIGYWPAGRAFCVFFGPTPISHGDEIRPAGPVNIVGRVTGDPHDLKQVVEGSKVRLERQEA